MAKKAPNPDEATPKDTREPTSPPDNSRHDWKDKENVDNSFLTPVRVSYVDFSESMIDDEEMTYKSFKGQPLLDDGGAPRRRLFDSSLSSPARLYIVNVNALRAHENWNDSWPDFWDLNCFSKPPEEYNTMLNETSFTAWFSNDNAPTLLLQAPKDGYGYFSLYFTSPSRSSSRSGPACEAIYRYARFLSPQELLVGSRFASLSVPQIGFPRDEKEYRKEYILKAGTHFMILPLRIYEEHVVLVKTLLGLLERRLALLEWELRGKGLNRLTNNQIADCNLLHQNLVLRWQFQKHMSNAMMHWLNTTTEDPRVKNDMHLPVGWPNKNSVPLPVEWLKEKLRRQIDIFTSFGPKFEALPRRLDNLSTAFFNAVLQQESRLNIEIAKSSAQIAEESRRDSSSMKTIAVLTLVFLPATSLASIFSMSMFNWQAQQGDVMVSRYVWIYFAFAAPLTLIILAIWLLWLRWTQRRHKSDLTDIEEKYGLLTQPTGEESEQRRTQSTVAPSLPADKYNYARPQGNPKIYDSKTYNYKALYDFIPEGPGEMGFCEGDIITDAYELNTEWCYGSHRGQSGLFPVNCVEKI